MKTASAAFRTLRRTHTGSAAENVALATIHPGCLVIGCVHRVVVEIRSNGDAASPEFLADSPY
jgi:hypothetical protein